MEDISLATAWVSFLHVFRFFFSFFFFFFLYGISFLFYCRCAAKRSKRSGEKTPKTNEPENNVRSLPTTTKHGAISESRGRNKQAKRNPMKMSLLSAQSEGGRRDGRRQVQALDDLLPQFLVDDVDESTASHHQVVQLVQIQHLFGHDRQTSNWRACTNYKKTFRY